MASGDEIEKPKCLVMAPTANAAGIIRGKTIESCLGINPHVKWNYVKASQERQSKLKYLYEEVKVIVLDELSMIGANKLEKMNLQLQNFQEGPDKLKFFGNKSIIAGGDMHQIPPIGERFITEKSTLDQKSICAPSHWDENFRIYHLSQKMRCAGDPEFASICDRVGEGHLYKEDEAFFMSRIKETELENDNNNFKDGKIAIICTTNKYRDEINHEKLEKLLPNERTYICESVDRTLNVADVPPLPKNLPYTKTGSLPSTLKIKVGAPIVITSNHKVKRFKEDGMVNGARGHIVFIEVSEKNSEEVTCIWVEFNNKEVGAKYRSDPEHLKLRKNLPLSEYATPILPIKKTFKVDSGNVEYQRKQFNLTLGYAITVHKVQGQTLEFVIVDFRDAYVTFGSFYVAITRTRTGDQLFLRDFHPAYIKTNKEVNEKISKMKIEKPYKFFKSYLKDKCFMLDHSDTKVGYLNVNDLKDAMHSDYVDVDKNLLNLDMLCLSDTRLTFKDDISKLFTNWEILVRYDCSDGRKHMGLLLLAPKRTCKIVANSNMTILPLTELRSRNGEVRVQVLSVEYQGDVYSFVYARVTPSKEETQEMQKITNMSTYIIGDLNLNPDVAEQKEKLDILCDKDKIIHLRAVTTVRSNQLDHILVQKDSKHITFTDCFHNFVSDHKCIILRRSHYANDEIEDKSQSNDSDSQENMDTVPARQSKRKAIGDAPDTNEVKEKIKKMKKSDETSDKIPVHQSLGGNSWLTDDAINAFNQLLMSNCRDAYIFQTYFGLSLFTLKRNYKQIAKFDKSGGLHNFRIVMFPLNEHSHWFLCCLEPQERKLYIIDPYIGENTMENIKKEHMKRLKTMEEKFLKPHQKKTTGTEMQALQKSVLMPPEVPQQHDGYNCGVFLLQFAR